MVLTEVAVGVGGTLAVGVVLRLWKKHDETQSRVEQLERRVEVLEPVEEFGRQQGAQRVERIAEEIDDD